MVVVVLHSFIGVWCQHLHWYMKGRREKEQNEFRGNQEIVSVKCNNGQLVRRSVIVFIWARPTRLSPPWHWQSQADNYDLAHCPCKQADGLGNICLAAECFWLWGINACTPTPHWPKYSKQDFSLTIFLKQLQSHFSWLTNSYAKAAGLKLILNVKMSTGFVLTSSDNKTRWVIHMWESDPAWAQSRPL